MLELLAGKAPVDQLARRPGVLPSTVEGWRQDALAGIEAAMRRGTGRSPTEVQFEQEKRDPEKVVTQLSIQQCLPAGAGAGHRARQAPYGAREVQAMNRETCAGKASMTTDQHSPEMLASVRQALVTAFGSPGNVPEGVEPRTDHSPQYTGADCADVIDEWNLEHTFGPVGRPTGNAVVERPLRTPKEEVLWLRDWESADELRAALEAWVKRYNEQRPHQALGWKTPAEYRAERLHAALTTRTAA